MQLENVFVIHLEEIGDYKVEFREFWDFLPQWILLNPK